MFFSIIIPVYNVERWLAQCLDSVLSQDFTDYEIIVIDDCSPDESYKIYDSYAKKHSCIRVIKHKVNKKLGGVRNTGIRAAQGEWILFLDSDDLMAQGALQFYHEKALVTQDGYFSGICDRIDEDNKTIVHPYFTDGFSKLYDNHTKVKLLEYFIVLVPMLWCKCYKKTFLLNNNFFFNENVFYEDMVFNAQLLLTQPNFVCYNMVCVHYRENLSSITQNAVGMKQIQRVEDWFKEATIFYDLIFKNPHYRHISFLIIMTMVSNLPNKNITKSCIDLFRIAFEKHYRWDRQHGRFHFMYILCFVTGDTFNFVINFVVIPMIICLRCIKRALRFVREKISFLRNLVIR